MERLFLGTITGCFLAIITINTYGILTTSNNDSGKCFLLSRRECQNKIANPSPSLAEGPVTPLPSFLPLSISEEGSTSARLIEVAND